MSIVEGFNEAGGFLPRKQKPLEVLPAAKAPASMRPEDFSPGNMAELENKTSTGNMLQ